MSRILIKILKFFMPVMNRVTVIGISEFSTKHMIRKEKMDHIFKTKCSTDN